MLTSLTKAAIWRNPRANLALSLAALFAVLVWLIFASEPEAQRKTLHASIPAVHTITVTPLDSKISLPSRGMLEPAQEAQLMSQVTGKVTYIADNFATGTDFKKGDILLKVEPAIAELELQRAKAQLSQARLAEMELKANLEAKSSLRNRSDLSPLAQGTPQRELAETNTSTAEAAVKLAEKQLEQTTLRAPFDGRVMMRVVQLHEQLAPGAPIARIYTTNQYKVRLPVTQQQLAFIDLPDGKKRGSEVEIYDDINGLKLKGHIIRSEGHIAQNRLIYLIAQLDDLTQEQQTRLLPGSLLDARISSRELANIIAIPGQALRANNTVWLLDDGHLKTRPVEVLYRAKDQVYLRSGVAPGEKIIVSHIAAVTENMRLRDLDSAPNEAASITP